MSVVARYIDDNFLFYLIQIVEAMGNIVSGGQKTLQKAFCATTDSFKTLVGLYDRHNITDNT